MPSVNAAQVVFGRYAAGSNSRCLEPRTWAPPCNEITAPNKSRYADIWKTGHDDYTNFTQAIRMRSFNAAQVAFGRCREGANSGRLEPRTWAPPCNEIIAPYRR